MRQHRLDLGLLLLRAGLGTVFVVHGWQKVFDIGLGGVTGLFESIGIPFAGLNALVVMTVELGGGLALLSGAATRVTAALLAATMFVATATVHWSNGFSVSNGGYEFTLTLLMASVALVFTGPGRISVDRVLFGRRRERLTADASTPTLPRAA